MPAAFQCSECGFTTNVKDELAGKKIKCPKCKAVGVVGGGGAPVRKAKKAKAEDSEDGLMAVNLDAYQDVEVPEGEVLDEQQAKAPKVKKKKKGKALDPQVKMAAIAFSLLSTLVIAGIVYFAGPVVLEAYQEFNAEKEEKPAGAAPADQPAN